MAERDIEKEVTEMKAQREGYRQEAIDTFMRELNILDGEVSKAMVRYSETMTLALRGTPEVRAELEDMAKKTLEARTKYVGESYANVVAELGKRYAANVNTTVESYQAIYSD